MPRMAAAVPRFVAAPRARICSTVQAGRLPIGHRRACAVAAMCPAGVPGGDCVTVGCRDGWPVSTRRRRPRTADVGVGPGAGRAGDAAGGVGSGGSPPMPEPGGLAQGGPPRGRVGSDEGRRGVHGVGSPDIETNSHTSNGERGLVEWTGAARSMTGLPSPAVAGSGGRLVAGEWLAAASHPAPGTVGCGVWIADSQRSKVGRLRSGP